jgi:hypothetical protein
LLKSWMPSHPMNFLSRLADVRIVLAVDDAGKADPDRAPPPEMRGDHPAASAISAGERSRGVSILNRPARSRPVDVSTGAPFDCGSADVDAEYLHQGAPQDSPPAALTMPPPGAHFRVRPLDAGRPPRSSSRMKVTYYLEVLSSWCIGSSRSGPS